MKVGNSASAIQLENTNVLTPGNTPIALGESPDGVFTIDLTDPDAPAESILESISSEQRSLIGMLLKPYDMIYHICEKGTENIKKSYQESILEAVRNFENTLMVAKSELAKVLTKREMIKLSELYDNKQINNDETFSAEIKKIINSMPHISKSRAIMQILTEGASLRIPLMLFQGAFSTPIPALPFCYSKAGIQMQVVISSTEVLRKLFGAENQSVGEVYLQAFLHLEGGVSGELNLGDYIDLPVSVKGVLTGLRVNHFGLCVQINIQNEAWSVGNLEYIIETVHRVEGNASFGADVGPINLAGQPKVGSDTVRQLIFPCNSTEHTAKFISHLALRALGAGFFGASALTLGVDSFSIKDAAIFGINVAGILVDMSGRFKPDRVVDIIETATIGFDIAVTTPVDIAYLGALNPMLMLRYNGATAMVHDVLDKKKHPENDNLKNPFQEKDMQLRYRKTATPLKITSAFAEDVIRI
ncbi:hypothetical protein [Rouxiella badensis]|uniref:hypothetical protein n=1 Tax=Rouxiella badensis TaxID=1646377 RepID=UPI0022AA7D9A|nr:hypothetical protein [Rouxiella badensis]WAT10904.1 hypothetical protein O1V65_10190 [Rouxiella badensis]